jgi:RNA polymerase sigma-70 factor (ECF subfamily)
LFKIARDLYIDKVRRDKVALNFTETIEPVNMIDDAENEINYKVLSKAYNEALVQMTESQREAFLLNRNEGLKYNEISKQLGITVKAVEKRISGALSILKRTIL